MELTDRQQRALADKQLGRNARVADVHFLHVYFLRRRQICIIAVACAARMTITGFFIGLWRKAARNIGCVAYEFSSFYDMAALIAFSRPSASSMGRLIILDGCLSPRSSGTGRGALRVAYQKYFFPRVRHVPALIISGMRVLGHLDLPSRRQGRGRRFSPWLFDVGRRDFKRPVHGDDFFGGC